MKFTLEIELGNDAMQTPEDIAKSLEHTCWGLRYFDCMEDLHKVGNMRDINGNTVGKWQVTA